MNINHTKMTLEINSCKNYEILEVRQGDKGSRIIDFAFTVNGETVDLASTMSAKVNATVDDVIVADSVSAVVDTENNVVTVTLTDTMLALSGICKMDIVLTEGDEIITAETVCLRVGKKVINGDSKAFPGASSIADITKEVENARGSHDSLGARFNGIDSAVTNKAEKSTVSQLSARMQTAEASLAGKANATDVANALKSKEDNSNKVSSKTDITDSKTNYPSIKYLNEYYYDANESYSSAETDELLGNKADSNSVYPKTETDKLLGEKADKADVSKLKDDLAEFYKPVSDLDNRKDVDLFISDSYGNILATFKDGEFITKEFSTVNSIGNNICDTLEECDLAISDVQGNVVFCIVDDNIITPKYNAKNHYKTFSILGDSYSTFKDYTDPLNNTQWYPPSDSATQGSENDVEDVENTWWHLFANDYKSLLIQNNSYSGSCISYDSYGTGTVDGKNFSFVKRCENLKKAELIIIEGGTNDAWSNVPLGEYKYSNWVESDFETFRPACSYVLDYIKRNNIGAKIIFVLNDGLKSSITESIKNICNYYNVDVLELSNIKKSNNHPNIEGMKQIKEQLINFLTRSDFNG